MTFLRNLVLALSVGYFAAIAIAVGGNFARPGIGDFCPIICHDAHTDWVYTTLPFGRERVLRRWGNAQ